MCAHGTVQICGTASDRLLTSKIVTYVLHRVSGNCEYRRQTLPGLELQMVSLSRAVQPPQQGCRSLVSRVASHQMAIGIEEQDRWRTEEAEFV